MEIKSEIYWQRNDYNQRFIKNLEIFILVFSLFQT